jgi:sigma54-dependent transcription regulator
MNYIGIIVAFIALCGVVITVIFNISNTRKQLFINTVTSSRIKWMGELRELVTEFVTLVSFHDLKSVETGEYRGKHLDKVISTKIRIKLQLNYQGSKDKEIINVIERLQVNYFELYSKIASMEKPPKEQTINFLGSKQNITN